jgi:hypothetical protein
MPRLTGKNFSAFEEMHRLFDEESADLQRAIDVLVEVWKDTKDPRIEEFFRSMGGLMINGKFMFNKNSEEGSR